MNLVPVSLRSSAAAAKKKAATTSKKQARGTARARLTLADGLFYRASQLTSSRTVTTVEALKMKSLVLCSALLLVLPLFLCAQSRQPLIAVGGISHESNSFNPAKTQLDDFSRRKTAPVDEVLEEWSKSSDIVSGYVEGARRFGLKLHPTLVAAASPKGIVTDAAFNTLMAELIRQLKAAPKLDGLLLDNHGAMVVESYPHGDVETVRRLREAMGPDIPHRRHSRLPCECVA